MLMRDDWNTDITSKRQHIQHSPFVLFDLGSWMEDNCE